MVPGIQLRTTLLFLVQYIRFKNRYISGNVLASLFILSTFNWGYAAEKTSLKYDWEKGQQFAYRIKIEVVRDHYSEIFSGIEQYTVTKSNADGFSIRCSGKLNTQTKSDSNRLRIPPTRMLRYQSPFTGLFHSMIGAFEPHILNVNRYGEINTIKGASSLPYLIGNLSEINLIPLSPKGDSEWSENENTKISIISTDRFPRAFRGSNVEKTMGAKQNTEYKITSQTPDEATIEVKHSYRTVAMVDGSPEVELSGTGTIQFDKKQGGVKSLNLKYKLFRRSKTSVHKIPITIASTQLSEAELLKYKADQKALREKHQAEMQKRKEASKFEIPENIDADLKKILTDLATTDVFKRKFALKQLSEAKPKQENPDISKILIKLLNSGDIIVVSDASKALVIWSTKADVPALIKLLPQVNILGLEGVIDAILKHRTLEGVKAVAELLKDPTKSHNASKKLIAYGSDAEDAVLDQLDPSNFITLVNIFRVLKEIGTEKSLKKISKVSESTDDKRFQFQATSTIKSIKARAGKD